MRRPLVLAFGTLFACSSSEPIDEHEMPEAIAPITQLVEGGPIAEGVLEATELAQEITVTPASPVSRAAVWLTFASDGVVPVVQAQAGWENGQTGPWITLTRVWSEGRQAIYAADLDTAASRLVLRLASTEGLTRIWWTANVPLAPEARSGTLPELQVALQDVAARSSWSAGPARCGSEPLPISKVTLFRLPAPPSGISVEAYLRAAQAFDQEGRHFCDVRANFLVADGALTGRDRQPFFLAPDGGRLTIAALSCSGPTTGLSALLGAVAKAHHLTSAAPFEVGASPVCKDDSAWLVDALAEWIATDPFAVEPEPEPEPEPTDATITGKVWDADTGDATTAAVLSGVAINCDCGRSASTDASGHYSLLLPAGTHQLTFAKSGYVPDTRSLIVVAGVDASLELGLSPTVTPTPGVSVIDQSYLITRWGGNDVDPLGFPETQDGFQAYLDAVGVVHFAAWELVVPNNAQVAADCGYTILLPDRAWWRKAGALCLLADQLRELVNEPVDLRNWWRPECYNAGVGGAAGGDHPDADALDLDFRSEESRAVAQGFLCETFWKRDLVAPADIAPGSNLNPRLNLSVGLGGITIHLGLLSSNGRRFWKYDSYSALAAGSDCW